MRCGKKSASSASSLGGPPRRGAVPIAAPETVPAIVDIAEQQAAVQGAACCDYKKKGHNLPVAVAASPRPTYCLYPPWFIVIDSRLYYLRVGITAILAARFKLHSLVHLTISSASVPSQNAQEK